MAFEDLARMNPPGAAEAILRAAPLLAPGLRKAGLGFILENAKLAAVDPGEGLDLNLLNRRKDETDAEWAAFCAFRDMGDPARGAGPYARNTAVLAKTLLDTAIMPGVREDELWRWCEQLREYRCWGPRVRVFDTLIARRALEATAEALDETKARVARLGYELASLAAAELAKLQRKSQANGDLEALDPKELIKMAEVGTKLQLLVQGMATERVENTNEFDLTKLTDEELKLHRELSLKARRG